MRCAARRSGFTLLELILVLAALSVIYLVAAPAIWEPRARESSALSAAIRATRDSAVRTRSNVRRQLAVSGKPLLLFADPTGSVLVDSLLTPATERIP